MKEIKHEIQLIQTLSQISQVQVLKLLSRHYHCYKTLKSSNGNNKVYQCINYRVSYGYCYCKDNELMSELVKNRENECCNITIIHLLRSCPCHITKRLSWNSNYQYSGCFRIYFVEIVRRNPIAATCSVDNWWLMSQLYWGYNKHTQVFPVVNNDQSTFIYYNNMYVLVATVIIGVQVMNKRFQ